VSGTATSVTCAGGGGSTVHIHPQAAPVVCRHVLDTLIQLAKVRVPLSCYIICYHICDVKDCQGIIVGPSFFFFSPPMIDSAGVPQPLHPAAM